jgi:hypothetical protein
MKTIEFLVKGSSPEPYHVTFTKDGDNLNALAHGANCVKGTTDSFCQAGNAVS